MYQQHTERRDGSHTDTKATARPSYSKPQQCFLGHKPPVRRQVSPSLHILAILALLKAVLITNSPSRPWVHLVGNPSNHDSAIALTVLFLGPKEMACSISITLWHFSSTQPPQAFSFSWPQQHLERGTHNHGPPSSLLPFVHPSTLVAVLSLV